MALQPGTILKGTYRIVRFIASGGFGCTYEAEHIELKARVAVKEFFVKDFCNRDELTGHISVGTTSKAGLVDKLRRKFKDEARAIWGLRHPGIVRVTDVFDENGTSYYVMDFIEGTPLSDMGTLPEKTAIQYISQVCDALTFVHDHNRLHLDIKPANIMVDRHGNAVLIDFGASKQYDEVDGQNTSTVTALTPGFAPVEQMDNDITVFSPATDVYSLGATLYTLLTGHVPPSASKLASMKLPELPVSVSPSTRSAVNSAMRLNKFDRPQSVGEFKQMLDSATVIPQPHPAPKPASTPTKPLPGGASGKTQSLAAVKSEKQRSGKGSIIVISLAIVVVVVGITWILLQNSIPSVNDRLSAADGVINGHEWVDLGLPSGLKWATCNVGAITPKGFGKYFAWGETTSKSQYTEGNCLTYDKDSTWLRSNGYIDESGNLTMDHDAARQNWGGTWRIPTKSEIDELVKNTTTTWSTLNGVKGRLVTSKHNGKSIFIPAAGGRSEASICDVGDYGNCWSSTRYESISDYAYSLYFNSDDFEHAWYVCYGGYSIRPVTE